MTLKVNNINLDIDQSEFEQALQRLVGLPLADIGRAADLAMFSFGSERAVEDRHGNPRLVYQYALHVQCAWRLLGRRGIVVASQDRYFPAGTQTNIIPDEFEWDQPNANRCDERVTKFLSEHSPSPVIVQTTNVGKFGQVELLFTDSFLLEVFPDHSLRTEHWRIFEPFSGDRHLVYFGVDG